MAYKLFHYSKPRSRSWTAEACPLTTRQEGTCFQWVLWSQEDPHFTMTPGLHITAVPPGAGLVVPTTPHTPHTASCNSCDSCEMSHHLLSLHDYRTRRRKTCKDCQHVNISLWCTKLTHSKVYTQLVHFMVYTTCNSMVYIELVHIGEHLTFHATHHTCTSCSAHHTRTFYSHHQTCTFCSTHSTRIQHFCFCFPICGHIFQPFHWEREWSKLTYQYRKGWRQQEDDLFKGQTIEGVEGALHQYCRQRVRKLGEYGEDFR